MSRCRQCMSTVYPAEVAFVSGLKSLASSLEWSGIGLPAGVQLPVQGRHDGELFIRRDSMPIYISRGKFTTDAVKGMLAKPENREEAVANLFKSCGGKLIGWYLTFGRHEWLVIGEFPGEKAAASAVLAGAGGGSPC